MSGISLRICIFFFLPLAMTAQGDGWNLEKEKSGVSLYTKVHPTSSIKSFRAEVLYQKPIKQILAALMDVESLAEYYDMTKAVEDFKQITEKSAEYTILFDFPFPVKDRYCRVFSEVISLENGNFIIQTNKVKSIKSYEGLLEVDLLDVKWSIEDRGNNQTKAIHYGNMDPSGSIPSWLANMNVIESPYKSMVALEKFSDKYSTTTIPWLEH